MVKCEYRRFLHHEGLVFKVTLKVKLWRPQCASYHHFNGPTNSNLLINALPHNDNDNGGFLKWLSACKVITIGGKRTET